MLANASTNESDHRFLFTGMMPSFLEKLQSTPAITPCTQVTILYEGTEKSSVLPTTDETLGTSGHGVGIRTGAGVTTTL